MSEKFDPHGKALRIEDLAKVALDHAECKSRGSCESRDSAVQQLSAEANDLWSDPTKLSAVSHELKKLNRNFLSTLPDVTILADEQGVKQFGFVTSGWDVHGTFNYPVILNERGAIIPYAKSGGSKPDNIEPIPAWESISPAITWILIQ